MKTINVEVEKDYLAKLASGRKPSLALAELIWNSVDADATLVGVDWQDNGLGIAKTITVEDNGKGMPYEKTFEAFRHLGGSWKRMEVRTAEGRMLHGKAGLGRFRAFALGQRIEWKTTVEDKSGKLVQYTITGTRDVASFTVSDPAPASAKAKTGTRVTISDGDVSVETLSGEAMRQELTEQFALYLHQYQRVIVEHGRRKIDPDAVVAHREELEMPTVSIKGRAIESKLTVVEWKTDSTSKTLVFCDGTGFGLAEKSQIVHVIGVGFTAYLQSDYLRELNDRNLLALDELSDEVRQLVDMARHVLRAYARRRQAELHRTQVNGWKEEKVYPYEGEPRGPVEEAERQVFDIVAVNVSTYLPEFDRTAQPQKKFAFRLLRQAIEDSPETVQMILSDVLNLPKDKQEDLAKLLQKTSLSAIIQASKVIADRLNFVRGLEMLVFDKQSKETLLERKQLHRILAANTWIFGEEFHLTADDESLNEVLVKHREALGSITDENSPVLRDDGSEGIIDLMLSRRVPQTKEEEREHLVIELKRPKKKIDLAVTGQIESYALAVANDERFRDTKTRWIFWAVSNEVTDDARKKAKQANRPDGILYQSDDPKITVWIRTWSQVIVAAVARLEFFRKELNYSADRASARGHLNDVYKKYLPDVLKDQPSPPTPEELAVVGAAEAADAAPPAAPKERK